MDSNDAPSEKDVVDEARNRKLGKPWKAKGKRNQVAKSFRRETRQKAQKVPPQANKASGDPSDPLNVDSDPDFQGLGQESSCVKGLESERERLKKSKTQLLQKVDGLRKGRVVVVVKVVPHVATEVIHSNEMGILVSRLAKLALFHGRYITLKEVAALKEPFKLEKMPGYRPLSKKEFDQAGDNLATFSYPFLAEVTVDLYAPLEVLLSKKPKSL
ncbi:hypothetical protein Tco_1314772 [Tanacetum coccineum]